MPYQGLALIIFQDLALCPLIKRAKHRGAVQTVLLPLEVILRRARGTIVLGIDRSVWYAREALNRSVNIAELAAEAKQERRGEAVWAFYAGSST